jgi:uncharacterized protein YbjT (DUF2867 family)
VLEPGPRLEVMTGSIDQRAAVDRAVDGVTHVLHLATSKETPETIIDVAVKGLFWLLEACRASRRSGSSSSSAGTPGWAISSTRTRCR